MVNSEEADAPIFQSAAKHKGRMAKKETNLGVVGPDTSTLDSTAIDDLLRVVKEARVNKHRKPIFKSHR